MKVDHQGAEVQDKPAFDSPIMLTPSQIAEVAAGAVAALSSTSIGDKIKGSQTMGMWNPVVLQRDVAFQL